MKKLETQGKKQRQKKNQENFWRFGEIKKVQEKNWRLFWRDRKNLKDKILRNKLKKFEEKTFASKTKKKLLEKTLSFKLFLINFFPFSL